MKTITKNKIDTGLIPVQYLPKVDSTDLTIHIPAYVGINLESIVNIEDWGTTIRIQTSSLVISLWKEIFHVHITIF